MIRKFILIFVTLSVFAAVLPVFPVKKTEAAVPIFETNAGLIASNLETAASSFGDLTQNIYEWAQTFIISTLKRQLLDVIVDQIIGYIQGGDKPKFVTNWKGFLEDAGQAAVGDFVQEIGAGFLCESFNLRLQISLLPVKKFSQRSQCTLDQIVGNINAFREDFRNGGWIGYSTSWEPQNNFFGAFLMAHEEKQLRQESAASAAGLEAISGSGYLGARDELGNIITPGSTLGSITAKAVNSDIDYILSAEQLADYASAIANALVNRVLTEGISVVQTAVSGSEQDAATDQYNSIIANNFEYSKNSILNQIDRTLVPKEQAATIIDAIITKLNKYKNDLQQLETDFNNTGKTFCPAQGFGKPAVSVDQVKQEILSEITQTDSDLAQLQQDQSENQTVIDSLVAAVNKINQLSNTDKGLTQLTQISNEITNLLNSTEAANFKSAIEAQNDAVDQNIREKIDKFNQQLQQCQTAP